MADNNITGFKKLIRYAENLAEYEKGIADGIIDENVFVIVLAEKCAKFKGQTFDWSGGRVEIDSELSDTSENAVQNKTVTAALATKQDVIDDLDNIRSGAAAGATALQQHQDISHLATKEELEELKSEVIDNEEAVAAALNDINDRFVTLNEVGEKVEALSNDAITREKIIATALTDLNTRLIDVVKRLDILENS